MVILRDPRGNLSAGLVHYMVHSTLVPFWHRNVKRCSVLCWSRARLEIPGGCFYTGGYMPAYADTRRSF
jgi:hypothetical protein